jgi:CTD small phosphatase-like protein 2
MGKLIKDLRLFENKKIEDMVILDSSAYSFSFQLDNGIPILEWDKSMRDDRELFRVMEVLIDIAHLSDLRQGLRNKLKLREIAH